MKPTQNNNKKMPPAPTPPKQRRIPRDPNAPPPVYTMPRHYKSDFQKIADKEQRARSAKSENTANNAHRINGGKSTPQKNSEQKRPPLPNYTARRKKKQLTLFEAIIEEITVKSQQLGLYIPFTAEQFIRAAICGVLIVLFALLQTTVFARFKPFGATPDLMFALTVALAFSEGEKWGGICGLICALTVDSLGGIGITLEPMLYMLAGCLCGVLARDFFSNTALPRVAVILLFTFARSAVTLICATIIVPDISVLQILSDMVIPEYFSTVLMSAPVYLAVWLCFTPFHKTRAERTS